MALPLESCNGGNLKLTWRVKIMHRPIGILAGIITIFAASAAPAQDLIAVEQSGNVLRIDKTTGAGTLI
jgi:hypothetical protein